MTTLRWWRLEDLLPLAEHAIAAPSQQLTRPQAAAYAVDGPVLIWTSTAEADRLTFNVLPGWYDEHGQPHHVLADSCRHPATGRLGSPGHVGPL